MRGPNKPKVKSDVNGSSGSNSTARRNTVASTQSGKKRASDPANIPSDNESHRRPILNSKRHSMPVLSANPKEHEEKSRPHSIHFGLGNDLYQGSVGSQRGEGEGVTIVKMEGLTGEGVHRESEMGTVFDSQQPQLTGSSSMSSSCSSYDESSMIFPPDHPGLVRHYTADGCHRADYGGQGMDLSMFHSSPSFSFRAVDGRSSR
jgi:hypothetical protein